MTDAGLAAQLADVGVILLMFGVGLHFSFAVVLLQALEQRTALDSTEGHIAMG